MCRSHATMINMNQVVPTMVPGLVETEEASPTTTNSSSSIGPYAGIANFPWKLHSILEDSSSMGFESIVSWVGNNGFKVHDHDEFINKIARHYFHQTRYKSFQRQLNHYGFERINEGEGKGVYVHPLFVRGMPHLCHLMQRVKIKGNTGKTKSQIPASKKKNSRAIKSNYSPEVVRQSIQEWDEMHYNFKSVVPSAIRNNDATSMITSTPNNGFEKKSQEEERKGATKTSNGGGLKRVTSITSTTETIASGQSTTTTKKVRLISNEALHEASPCPFFKSNNYMQEEQESTMYEPLPLEGTEVPSSQQGGGEEAHTTTMTAPFSPMILEVADVVIDLFSTC